MTKDDRNCNFETVQRGKIPGIKSPFLFRHAAFSPNDAVEKSGARPSSRDMGVAATYHRNGIVSAKGLSNLIHFAGGDGKRLVPKSTLSKNTAHNVLAAARLMLSYIKVLVRFVDRNLGFAGTNFSIPDSAG